MGPMVSVEAGSVEDFFGDSPFGREVYDAVADLVDALGPVGVRVGRSQVAFRHARGFCWQWLPGRYLAHPAAEVVLSVSLDRRDPSRRWKQVVRVDGHWMHHLEVRDPAALDEEVAGWLSEAYTSAG